MSRFFIVGNAGVAVTDRVLRSAARSESSILIDQNGWHDNDMLCDWCGGSGFYRPGRISRNGYGSFFRSILPHSGAHESQGVNANGKDLGKMKALLVTGSSGLIGSEVCAYFARASGYQVHGVDNNQRAIFFGPQGDTRWNQQRLLKEIPGFIHHELDVRDRTGVLGLLQELRPS
jgi:hypothetical protein